MAEAGTESPDASPVRPLIQLMSSNLLGTFAGGVFFIVATFNLSIEDMGRYTVAISAQWIAVGLLGSGLSVAAMRLAADRLELADEAGAAGVVLQAVAIVLCVTAVVASGCWALQLAMPAQIGLLPVLVACWVGARSFIDCIRSGFLARHDFGRAALMMVGTAATGLTALGIVFATGPLTLERLLIAHVSGLAAGSFVAIGLALPLMTEGFQVSRDRLQSLVRYARWPALAEGTRLLQLHIGPFMLVTFATAGEAGLFGVARYPAYVFDVIALSLYQYWLSNAVRRSANNGLGRFLGAQFQLAAGIGVLVLVAAFAVRPLLELAGSPFDEAASLFVLNALDFAILLLVRPAESAYHGLHKPWLEWVQRLTVLPLLLVAGAVLVPRYGATGMVAAHILTGVAALGVAALLLRGQLQLAAPVAGGAEQ